MEFTPDLPEIVQVCHSTLVVSTDLRTDARSVTLCQQVANCWTPAANDVLPYAPSTPLLEEARASMLYAPQSYPLVDSSLPVQVLCLEVLHFSVRRRGPLCPALML